jgi:hypothetical protein
MTLPIEENDPNFRVALSVAHQAEKLRSYCDVIKQLSDLSANAKSIARVERISDDQFFEIYYTKNTPVLITGIMGDWPALGKWTPEFFRQRFGNEAIEVMGDRNNDPEYEINCYHHKKVMKFSDFIEQIECHQSTNDIYLTANNHLLDRPIAAELYQDISIFPEYLVPSRKRGFIYLWFGPRGTVTPLHHDAVNVLFAQVHGSKKFILVSPNETPNLYNEIGVYSSVNCEMPDFDRHPKFKRVTKIEFNLHPGEVLFIPVGWWHYVRSLATSISLSFTNFKYSNSFIWHHPQMVQVYRKNR